MLDLKAIGLRIRRQREFLGLSRERLADFLGVTQKFSSDIELGVKGMSLQTLCSISDTLSLSVDYILFVKQDRPERLSNIVNMLSCCSDENIKYAEVLLKDFIMAANGTNKK